MVVRHERALVRGELAVEAVDADAGEAEAAEVRHVLAHHLREVETLLLDGLVVHREGRIVVDAEERHLASVVRPAHHALGVHFREPVRARHGEGGERQRGAGATCCKFPVHAFSFI